MNNRICILLYILVHIINVLAQKTNTEAEFMNVEVSGHNLEGGGGIKSVSRGGIARRKTL
jgi:hypothetical protein